MEMSIEEFLEKIEQGYRAKINLRTKKAYLNREEVEVNAATVADAYSEIEKLYANYKRSYPSERSQRSRDYFKALSPEELALDDLVNMEDRTLARARLEVSLLCWVLNGSLKWKDNNKWFWQSKIDPELIILKEWVI